jgi:DNA-binding Lrp family transcriptional regulator
MLQKKDLLILSGLRANARETLTGLSRKTSVPISTIFDKLKQYEESFIKNHAALINFSSLGFTTRANVMVKVARDSREKVKLYLQKHPNVNTIYKINNGFDYMLEAIFKNINQLEDFLELLDHKFGLLNKEVYYIVEDIRREAFLSDPSVLDLVINEKAKVAKN